MHRTVNSYISILIITIVGSIAALIIINTDMSVDTYGLTSASIEMPNLQEELERN